MSTTSKSATTSQSINETWSEEELRLLVKASQLFPVGTASRWDVIAEYINEHSGSEKPKTGKHVIHKVKHLKKLGKFDPLLTIGLSYWQRVWISSF